MSELNEYEVANARMRTRALIAETRPILDDLVHTLDGARELLERLEQEEREDG